MTETPEIAIVQAAMRADAQEIVDDLATLRAKLAALRDKPHWFAGLPETLTGIYNVTEHHARAITQGFGLESA